MAWADRWANIKTADGKVINEARAVVRNIQADTKREVDKFPRTPEQQLKFDIMHEKEFALIAQGVLSKDDLWSQYLSLTRKTRLRRIRTARRTNDRTRTAATVTEPVAGTQSKVQELISMLPDMYVVTTGADLHDRLVVRNTSGVLDGYYVFQRGSLAQRLDQFSIQVYTQTLTLTLTLAPAPNPNPNPRT